MTEVRELRFGHQRRRVWLDGLPPCEVVAEHWLQAHRAAALGQVSLTRAAAEFFVPTNHAHFGILGGSFTASANSSVNVRVVVSNSCEKQVDWSLTWPAERVFTGLPAAYAEVVLSSALAALGEFPLGPGTLVFDHAAHGEISSNQFVFGWLAHSVVRLLQRADPISPESDISALLARPSR